MNITFLPRPSSRRCLLVSLLACGTLKLLPHEQTRRAHEASLDPHATRLLLAAADLCTRAPAAPAAAEICQLTLRLSDAGAGQPRPGLLFGYGEEYRHSFPPAKTPARLEEFEGYGHVMFLDIRELIEPAMLGRVRFAHTSPIYVEIGGRKIFPRDTAQTLVAEMESSLTRITAKGIFDNEGQREGVVQIYRDGIATLRRRPTDEPR